METALTDLEAMVVRAGEGMLTGECESSWRALSAQLLRESFMQILESESVDLLLEVGAHQAEASVMFVKRTTGRAIAFEANPFTFDQFTKKAADHGVDARNLGIGERKGQMQLLIPLKNSKRYLTPGSASFRARVDLAAYEVRDVAVMSIDDVVRGLPSGPCGLWIDAEGTSMEVLKGAEHLLGSGLCRAIMIELEATRFWSGQATADQIDAWLVHRGFSAVMRDAEYELQFNVVYVLTSGQTKIDEIVRDYWCGLAGLSYAAKQHRRRQRILRPLKRMLRLAKRLTGVRAGHQMAQ